jgi:hypothetical protein
LGSVAVTCGDAVGHHVSIPTIALTMSAHTRIAYIFASVLHITCALAAVDADTTSVGDSEAVDRIIACASAGQEAVLLREGVRCIKYRDGGDYHISATQDTPLKIDADQICAESERGSKDWRRLSGGAIKRIVSLMKGDPHGLRIIGAVFCEQLDLAGVDLPYTLVIDRSLFFYGFEARNFHTRGDLSFSDSLALGEVTITRSHVGGAVYGDGAFIKKLRILDSQIDGSLIFRGATIFDPAIFDTVSLSGELSVRRAALSYFVLHHSKINGELDLTDSQARCAYLITESEIGDFIAVNAGFGTSTREQTAGEHKDLFDWRLSPNDAVFRVNANAQSSLAPNNRECQYRNIAFPGNFLVSDTHVRSSLCFRYFNWLVPKNGPLLPSSVIFNDLQVDTTTFIDFWATGSVSDQRERKLEAIGIKTNTLMLNPSGVGCGYDPNYYKVSPAYTEVLLPLGDMRSRDKTRAEPNPEKQKALPSILIDRLDFNQWATDLATSKYLLANNQTFSPILYEKIANFYKRSGLYSESAAIQFLKRNADYAHSDGFTRAALFVSWATVGYGLYPATGFLWFGVLILIGYYVFRTGEKAVIDSYRPRSWFVYSIDTIIPVIKLDPEHEKIRFAGWRQYYLYAMKIMSAILVFLVLKVLQDTIVVP